VSQRGPIARPSRLQVVAWSRLETDYFPEECIHVALLDSIAESSFRAATACALGTPVSR